MKRNPGWHRREKELRIREVDDSGKEEQGGEEQADEELDAGKYTSFGPRATVVDASYLQLAGRL
jgi:hypothetical protein